MSLYQLNICVIVEAENLEEVWVKFKASDVHDSLNSLDYEGSYESVVLEIKHES